MVQPESDWRILSFENCSLPLRSHRCREVEAEDTCPICFENLADAAPTALTCAPHALQPSPDSLLPATRPFPALPPPATILFLT